MHYARRVDFDAFRQELRAGRLREVEAWYGEASFGSWYVVLEGRPRRRVVWDGKEHFLSIEHQVEGGWEEQWFVRDPADQTPAKTLAALARLK